MYKPFSIIVPIYKVQEYLEQCVTSIIQQTYRDIEIILVDDGSPDECPEICDGFAAQDDRITVIHKEHGGVVSARQEGALASSGEYICCVDGDDVLAPDYIEKMAEVIEQYRPDMVCCGYLLHVKKDRGISYKPRPRPGLFTRQQIEQEIFPILLADAGGKFAFDPHLWNKAIRREIYLPIQLGIDQRIVMAEDVVCTKPCVCDCASIYLLDDVLYRHNMNPHSLTHVWNNYTWQGALLVAETLRRSLDMGRDDFQDQWDRSTARSFFVVALAQFNRRTDYFAVRREIREMMAHPTFRAAIRRCRFRFFCKGKVVELLLKSKCIFGWFLFRYALKTYRLLRMRARAGKCGL